MVVLLAAPDPDAAIKFELIAVPILLVGLLLAGRRRRFRFRPLTRAWGRLGRRRPLSIAVTAMAAFLTSGLVYLIDGFPVPLFHDEFSYLLAADTFAHGRLTNPPHPLWHHFESFHIIHQPTYMTKFLPGQGLFLLLGRVVFGHPAFGVWLSFVLASAATCWMLQAWQPPRWALWGGLLVAVHPRFLLDWGHSYWGGCVAMLGGALVFGTLRRVILDRPSTASAPLGSSRRPGGPSASSAADSWLLGIGLSLLAITRPVEGLLASIPAIVLLLRRPRLQVLLPAGLVVSATASFVALVNYRITGSPVRLPYQVHEETYGVAPLFLWQQPNPVPYYRHDAVRDFHLLWSMGFYHKHFPIDRLPSAQVEKLLWLWRFYLQVVLAVPLVALPWIARRPWSRFALLTISLVVLGVFTFVFLFPHYVAPITCLIILIAVQGLRQLRAQARCWPGFRLVVGGLALIWVLSWALTLQQALPGDPESFHRQRARLVAELEATGEKHLVIVRYRPGHLVYQEWVYNQADIDASVIVWARDMGLQRNQELLDYFHGRRVWLLQANGQAVLQAYPLPPAVPP